MRIEADGYRPAQTGRIRKTDAPHELTVRLDPDPGLGGRVLAPDGSPAAGATLGIALPNRELQLQGRALAGIPAKPAETISDRWRQPFFVTADDQGKFRLLAETDPSALLVVVHETATCSGPSRSCRWARFSKRHTS